MRTYYLGLIGWPKTEPKTTTGYSNNIGMRYWRGWTMSKILAAIILGVFILMAAVVIADPSQSAGAWEFAMAVIKWVCIGVIAIVVIVLAFLAYLGSRWWSMDECPAPKMARLIDYYGLAYYECLFYGRETGRCTRERCRCTGTNSVLKWTLLLHLRKYSVLLGKFAKPLKSLSF